MKSLCETSLIPVEEPDECWRQDLYRTLGAVDFVAPGAQYTGAIQASRLSHLKLATMAGSAMRLSRAHSSVMEGDELLVIMLMVTGSATVEQYNRRIALKPGEMVFCDMTRPMSLGFPGPYRVKLLAFPRRLLGLPEERLQQLTATPIRPDTTMASLVAAHLQRLVDIAARCPSPSGAPLASSTLDLLSLLAEEQVPPRPTTPVGLDRLQEIKRFIEQNIADPDLTPQSVAHANSISVRYLHKLFLADSGTVGQWIQQCRLQKCRTELARRDATKRSIAGVARQWGFTSPSHFSRAFRSLYGVSPAEWRGSDTKEPTKAVRG
ncbi:helix-turn-helix domain-containing protein [Streptomyces sp. NPDC005576]|uniref:helix-turn-helix domain-containing protein n=1 Tax=Streptomyces sp. NPDC005576 TaxID=3364726 RepID=UPI0036C96AC9